MVKLKRNCKILGNLQKEIYIKKDQKKKQKEEEGNW